MGMYLRNDALREFGSARGFGRSGGEGSERGGMSVADPDWDDFKVLLALERGGSVAGAARRLGIDNSTVSRRLAALEEALGAVLLVRGGREFAFTNAGREALCTAATIETATTDLNRAMRGARDEIKGTVRVSCPSGLAPPMTGLLAEIGVRHPGLVLELNADNRTVDIAKGETDIAVRMFAPAEPGLVGIRSIEMGWGVFASRAYADRCGLPSTIEDLPQHRLVLYVEALQRVPGPRWIEDRRGKATAIVRVDNTEVAHHAIASGAGLGVIPCFIGDAAGLVRVFPEPVAFNTGWLVYHESLRRNASVRATFEAIAEYFRANRALYEGRG